MRRRLTRGLAYALLVLAAIAALLNSAAAVADARRGEWLTAVLYLVIAVTIGTTAFLGWYTMTRQRPYRWRGGDSDRDA